MDEDNIEESRSAGILFGCLTGILVFALFLIGTVVAFLIIPLVGGNSVTIEQWPFGLVGGADHSFSGIADPDSEIELLLNGDSVGMALSDSEGVWSLTVPVTAAGAYLATARYSDATTGPNNGVEFRIAEPLVIMGDPILDELTADGSSTIAPFVWSGSGEPGTNAELFVDGELFDSVEIGEDGSWIYPGQLTTPPGNYDFSVKMMSQDAVQLDESDSYAVSIPAIGTDGLPYSIKITNFQIGQSSLDPVVVEGEGEPNTKIVLSLGDIPIRELVAGSDRNWRFSGFIPATTAQLTASAVDTNDVSVITSEPFELPSSSELGNLSSSGADTGALQISFAVPGSDGGDTFLAGSPAVELIVDASWSMTFPLDSSEEADRLLPDDPDSRISIAKEALFDLIDNSLPAGSPVALRAFGNIEGDLSCRTDLMLPLNPANKGELNTIVGGIEPQFNANTAIAASLAEVANDLADTTRDRIIVLLTDGEETCGGDPAAEIEALAAQGINTQVNIVGFAINDESLKAEFGEWAQLGNGTYFDAADAQSLSLALQQAMTVIYRVIDLNGDVAASGIVGGAPIELEPGSYVVELRAAGGDRSYDNVVIVPGGGTQLGCQSVAGARSILSQFAPAA